MARKSFHVTRENVALLIFIALLLVGGAIACSYFFLGKQLNTTATVVDDATGNMQDYSMLVFPGVRDPAYGSNLSEIKDSAGNDAYASSLGQGSATLLKEKLVSDYQKAHVEADSWRNHVFVSEVRDNYELKGASVATLDLSNLNKYVEPTIIDVGRRKFGIFSIGSYLSKAKLKSDVEILKSKGAQSIVCITQNISMLPSYTGLDAVISLTDVPEESKPNVPGLALLVESPAKGSVGVLLFSNTNATSYKTVKTI